jgi:NAD(P)H-nitrite reductase large subunit
MAHIVIIGNGIAGITVARHVRKQSNHAITVISAESKFHFSRTALMYVYMGHLKLEHTKPYEDFFWTKNRITLRQDLVTHLDTDSKHVQLQSGERIAYDKLVIASGSTPNRFGWRGENLLGVQGLYSIQDLALMESSTNGISHAVIVGGGLIGIEVAEMLHTRGIGVTFLVREKNYWGSILPKEESAIVEREIHRHHLDLRCNTELDEILPDANGRVRAVRTRTGEEITCQFVALTAGVSPNIAFLKSSSVQTGRGVLVNAFLETSVPDVYACGDCAELVQSDGTKKVEQLWYTGRLQGEALAQTLSGNRTAYGRGIWFNSAKFFNVEYQTYGFVPNVLKPDDDTLYWEHPDGTKCIRIVFDKESRAVTGFNVFGIRYRQAVCEAWIREKKSVEYVAHHLHEANFDAEFSKRYDHLLAPLLADAK